MISESKAWKGYKSVLVQLKIIMKIYLSISLPSVINPSAIYLATARQQRQATAEQLERPMATVVEQEATLARQATAVQLERAKSWLSNSHLSICTPELGTMSLAYTMRWLGPCHITKEP